MGEIEETLRLRKLRAETELAELKLEQSKIRHRVCVRCNGHGYLDVGGSYFDNRDGKPHKEDCGSCRGAGRICIHPKGTPCEI